MRYAPAALAHELGDDVFVLPGGLDERWRFGEVLVLGNGVGPNEGSTSKRAFKDFHPELYGR